MLAIERRAVESLIPYARNARTHTDAQVAQIAASITEFGWTNPVLIDGDDGIIAGHGRVLAARKLGMTEAPCIALTHLTAAQKRALVLADNKLALNAGWDDDLLRIEIGDLTAEGFNTELVGFSEAELKKLLEDSEAELTGEAKLGDGLRYQVVVDCRDETDQGLLLERLKGEGRECRPLIL